MSKLVLDISQCRLNDLLEKNLRGITQIPICHGMYGKDYDVVEEELPSEVVKVLRNQMLKEFRAGSEAFDLPIGIDECFIPELAKIKEIES